MRKQGVLQRTGGPSSRLAYGWRLLRMAEYAPPAGEALMGRNKRPPDYDQVQEWLHERERRTNERD